MPCQVIHSDEVTHEIHHSSGACNLNCVIRVVILGSRNYMLFHYDGGGDSAAVMFSLIGSCELNGIEPETWLRHVISVINTWPANRVKELLPWNVALSVN